ncbi:MAG: AAA family ATPase [Desulfovibrio fairfieldensis]
MSYTVQNITIKDFKSIADLTLDLGKINVLIGENGAGKSNILEAIGVLSAAVDGRVSYAGLKERGVRLSAPEVFKIALKKQKRKNRFALSATLEHEIRYRVSLSPKREDTGDNIRYWTEELKSGDVKIASRGPRGRMTIRGERLEKPADDSSVLTAARSLSSIDENIAHAIDILQKYAIYAPSTPILRNIATDESAKSPLGLYGGSLAPALGTIFRSTEIKKILSTTICSLFPWIQKTGRATPEPNLVSQHIHTGPAVIAFQDKRMLDNFNKLFAYDVSEGVLYALFLLVLILHDGTPPFFAVDNMDSALNPRMADKLLTEAIRCIKEKPEKQMLLTTHNPAMLNAVDLFDDDIRLFVVERSEENGSTIARRINPAAHMNREKWRELVGNSNLANIWTSGALGGLPNI